MSKPMKKKSEGYVELGQLKEYRAKKSPYIVVFWKPAPGYDCHVTLSPVEDPERNGQPIILIRRRVEDQEPAKEPNHKEALEAIEMVIDDNPNLRSQDLLGAIESIKVDYGIPVQPQGDQPTRVKRRNENGSL